MPDNEPLSTQQTPWTLILSAQGPDADPVVRRECLETLFTLYRKPISRFFRRLGFADPDDRDDLVQELFVHIMEKNLIDRLDRDKGSFRSYLKTTARRVACDARRLKDGRHPLSALSSPPPVDAAELPAAEHDAAEAEFDRGQARATLEAALSAFRRDCEDRGLTHWYVAFARMTLGLPDKTKGRLSTADVAAQLGMTIKQVENIVVLANKRFRKILRDIVMKTVGRASEVDAEIAELRRILSESPLDWLGDDHDLPAR